MLEVIRTHAKTWIAKVILALITVPFAFWGIDSYFSGGGKAVTVASVGDTEISEREFQQALNNQRDGIQEQGGKADVNNPAFRKQVLDQLVDTPEGPKRQKSRISMFRLGGIQYELIEVEIDETGAYAHAQDNGGKMRFHHICMRVPDFEEFRKAVGQQDLPLVFERNSGPEALSFAYLDGRKAFGHYLEYVCMPDAMWERISAM